MLVMSRKMDETIVVDGDIRITVVGIRGGRVRLGIEAPDQVGIVRGELVAPARAEAGRGEPSWLRRHLRPPASPPDGMVISAARLWQS